MSESYRETVDAVLAEYEDEPDGGNGVQPYPSMDRARTDEVRSTVYSLAAAAVGAGILLSGCNDISPDAEQQVSTSPGEEERYAVVIGGTDNAETSGSNPDQYVLDHENNIALAYKTLIQQGFDEDNIYVLFHGGEQHEEFPVSGPATRHFIQNVFPLSKTRSTATTSCSSTTPVMVPGWTATVKWTTARRKAKTTRTF